MSDSQKATRSISRKQSYMKRIKLLEGERSSFINLWRELSDFHLSHRGRFLLSDRNKGHKRNTKMINNTSRRAIRTLASGMMAGITSPARPWFKLALGDTRLMDNPEVKSWLLFVERVLREVFNASNTYNSLHSLYQEIGVFGTGAMGVYENYDNVIRCKTYTIGSYMIGVDGDDMVDSWGREYQKSAGQLVKEFGYENCSNTVQKMWDNGNTEAWVDICHLVEPNDNRDHLSPMAKHKKTRSVYFEKSSSRMGDKFLRESGFDEFPVLCPRWDIAGEDIYATACPGIDAIGDTKALQLSERFLYEGIEKRNNPHMVAPTSLRNVVATGLPAGEISFVDGGSKDGLRPVYQFDPQIQDHSQDIYRIQDRIDKAFYVDLFLMLANSDRRQITAREVAEKHEEKLLMLGPVLERLHNELLDPLIDRTFNIALRSGILGEVPATLAESGQKVKIEYISVLAQAQRMVATGAIERVASFVGSIASVWPEARHKLKADKMVDDYSESSGLAPDIIANEAEFNEAVEAEQQAAMAQQAAASMPQAVDSAQTLSKTERSGEDGLTAIMQRMGLG